ncbi:uncharacterized protein J4E84_002221 [Alternaria hordeiaustralica]|uniref:uncharacterized protein n=1 Tax=Alternaria hordeiaustralica TaxID=1187925 RepID=UPI0020C59978|nr:uncharacterized protein J4E84_002221 [Alternaria hordeiaustralica]KAI4693647.1 hypothetical protein J4E84_002221 [Alternaria hordeiaustralica]
MKDEPATSSPPSTPTNTKLMTMSPPDTPFASTKNQMRGKAGPVSHSPILRHRARSLSSGLPPRGLVASRVNTINMVSPLTDVVVPAHSDRDTLPSQAKPSSPTSTPQNRPGARSAHSSPLKRKCKIDDFALPPPPPTVSANEAAQDDILAASNLVTSSDKGIVQSEISNNEPFKTSDDSTAGTTPFHRGHRRNKTSLSQVVPRSDPLKGTAYGTESFRATAGQYSHWPADPHYTPSPDDYSGMDVFSCDTSPDVRATKRKSLPGYSSTTSTMESGRSEEFHGFTLSPRTTVDETKEDERSPSVQSYTPSYAESSPRAGATSPAAALYLPLRRAEKFNDTESFNTHTSPFSQYEYALLLSNMDTDDVRELYPLETFVQAIAQDGCAIHDWASPWPSEQPVKKLLRFASRPDFAPSMHYESESDDYPSLQNLLDLDEHGPEPRRSPLSAVKVPDQAQDGELATLAPVSYYPDVGSEMTILLPRTYNATSDDDEETLPSRTYNANANHELTCLLPLTYNPNSMSALENASPIKRKPILRKAKDKSLRSSVPSPSSSNWVVHDGYDSEEDLWTKPSSGAPLNVEASDLHQCDDLDDRDADVEPIHIEKRHYRNGLKTTHEQTANSVGKFIEPRSDADVIKEPVPIGSINRRPLPTISHVLNPPLPANTGVLNLDFQFPSRNPQQQRGVSMPLFPPPSAVRAQEKKNARRKSFRQLLGATGNKEGGTETTTSGDKPKKSLGRRISQMGRRLSSIWSK